MKDIEQLLVVIQCEDLYDFLKLDQSATPAQLREAAEKQFNSIQNRGLKGPRWDAKKTLVGKSKAIFESEETKAEYDRYLGERTAREAKGRGTGRTPDFDEGNDLLRSGLDCLNQGHPKEAARLAKLLTENDSRMSAFRLNVAQRLLDTGDHAEAFAFIDWCRRREPASDEYPAMLGGWFAKGGTAGWPVDPVTRQVFADTQQHVTDAQTSLEEARELAGELRQADYGLDNAMAELQEHLRVATLRKWNGNTLAAIGAVLAGLSFLGVPGTAPWASGADAVAAGALFGGGGVLVLISAAMYIAGSFDPNWKVNAQLVANRGAGVPLVWYFAMAVLTMSCIHIVGPWKFGVKLVMPHLKRILEPYLGRWSGAVGGVLLLTVAVGVSSLALMGVSTVTWLSEGGEGSGNAVRGGQPAAGSVGADGEGEAGREGGGGSEEAVRGAQVAEAALNLDGSSRRQIQAGLSAAGFDPGPADGVFGEGTREAIRGWQRARGLQATGYLHREAVERLGGLAVVEEPPGDPPRPPAAVVDARGAAGTLNVRGDPSSSIEVDGEVVGVVPASGVLPVPDLAAGRHFVTARREGYVVRESEVGVAAGRAEVVNVTLEGMPGRLTVSAGVDGAVLRIDGADERPLPVTDLEIQPGSHDLTVSLEGYRPVERSVDVRPGQLVNWDFSLEAIPDAERVAGALDAALSLYLAQDYRAAVDAARSALDVIGDSQTAYSILGNGLYQLGQFEESVAPLANAIALGADVVLPAKHRHGGGGFREGFCQGTLTLSVDEIAFVSRDEPGHGFAVAPDKVAEPTIAGLVGGFPYRLNTSVRDPERGIERNNFDFVHRNAARQAEEPDSPVIVLRCPDCDASLHVQEALMTVLIGFVNR